MNPDTFGKLRNAVDMTADLLTRYGAGCPMHALRIIDEALSEASLQARIAQLETFDRAVVEKLD